MKEKSSKKSHTKDDKEKHLKKVWKPHEKLINFVKKKLKKAKEVIVEIKEGLKTPEETKPKIEKVEYYIAEAEKQIEQITSRVFNGETIPHSEKTFSVYKPYTEWINKGKIGVPVELGVRLCIIDDQYGFILNHIIMYNQTDDKVAVQIIEDTIKIFPNINSVSFDRG